MMRVRADAIHVLVVGVFKRSDGRVTHRDTALTECDEKPRKDKQPPKGTREPSIGKRNEKKRKGKRAFRGLHRTLVILMLMLLPACASCNRPALGPPVAPTPALMPWRSAVVRQSVSNGQDAMKNEDARELPWESLSYLSSTLCVMLDWAGLLNKLAWKRAYSRRVLRCRRVAGRRHKRVRGWLRVGAVACRPLFVMRRKPSYDDRLDVVKRLLREKLEKRKAHDRFPHLAWLQLRACGVSLVWRACCLFWCASGLF